MYYGSTWDIKALAALIPRGDTERMFFAALMPWLADKIGWSVLPAQPERPPQLWLVMRVLPGVQVLGTRAPPPLEPADFEACPVPGLEFLHIYFGRDLERHWCTAVRLAQAH